jgi:deazaflavin-dependent oxidoreductase (nitroreductase family)
VDLPEALIETTGRTSGQPRRVPVGNGLRGDEFWIVAEHGYAADYVKNIHQEHPAPAADARPGRQPLNRK